MTLSASKCSPRSCILNSLTVKPTLEKHLSEEVDGAGMQTLLQIGKLKICGPPFHVFISKLQKVGILESPVWGNFLARVVEKFEFCWPCLGGPPFRHSKILSNFVFPVQIKFLFIPV